MLCTVTATAATHVSAARRRAWLRYPISARFARDFGYLTLTLGTAVIALTLAAAGLSIAVSFAILIIGIPVIVGVAYVNRGWTSAQRRLSGWQLGDPIPSPYRPPLRRGLGARVLAVLTDPQTWRDLAWLAFDSIVGFALGVIHIAVWGTVVGSLLLPAWWWSMPDDAAYLWMQPGDTGESFVGVAIGLVLLPVATATTRWFAVGHARVARALLGPGKSARVEQLTESRAGAVDAAHEELQRIERDLHDGAQARLVALAMDLGMAERKIADDPAGGRELVGEAREEALRALAELRELVRGIGPSILRDRGLEAAIRSLVAGRALPVDVQVDAGTPRPTDTVEAAAYFVVAESIANAAKHSGASRAAVRVWRDAAGRLVVECSDDGRGGADVSHGTGLSGLAKRVAALDGAFTVSSPAGGPTVVRAEIPCAS